MMGNSYASLITQPIVEVFVTGDLAFQAMALVKDLMAGHWCMQCTSPKAKFLEDGTLWKMEDIDGLGIKLKNDQTQLGIKQQPLWPFITLKNYMVPLLYCEVRIGNQLLDKLGGIIYEHIF